MCMVYGRGGGAWGTVGTLRRALKVLCVYGCTAPFRGGGGSGFFLVFTRVQTELLRSSAGE
jgi:hypothetical protein